MIQKYENYLNDHNIKELQYFVGTHAHEDHIEVLIMLLIL